MRDKNFLYYGANDPDIRSLCGFAAPDPVLFLAAASAPVLLVSSMEYGRALKESRGCAVETAATLGLPHGGLRASSAALAIAALRKHGVRQVSVAPEFPLFIAREIEREGVKVDIETDSPAKARRLVKTEEEIAFIAASQNAARAAMRAVGKAIRGAEAGRGGILRLGAGFADSGKILTSERARAIVRAELARRNCFDADGTIIAGGIQACDPHQAGSGPLKTGEFVVCDIFPKSLETGYWGDMTRTFFHGRIAPARKKMLAAVQSAHDAVVSSLKAGVSGAAMHELAAATLRAAGFESGHDAQGVPFGFIHGTGHGVGLEIHEEPRLSPSGGALPENAVVTIEPGLYYSELGGVRIEDLAVVRAGSAQIL